MTAANKPARKRAKRNPSTVTAHGVRVRLFKRGKTFWLDVQNGDERTRVSAKTTVRSEAETHALALAESIAKQRLLGVTPDTLTIGALFEAYERHKGKTLEGQWKRASATRQRLFRAAWGADRLVISVSQTTVDEFSAGRRVAWLEKQQRTYAAQCAKAAAKKKPQPPAPTFHALRDGALECDFRWLSSVFNWGVRHKTADGKRLLVANPLHDCDWPREKQDNIRRPIASHDRYTHTLAKTDDIDPQGRFRLALTLARYTARRVDAILHLRASDVLLTTARIRAALASAGQDEGLAEHMVHGAIRWRAPYDKQRIERITPISSAVRAEIDRYFQLLDESARVAETWLMPHTSGEDEPLSRATATNWLRAAEQRAELPKLRGGLWHAYRRLWATERKSLPDVDVAEAGGWTGTKAMKMAYQHATPQGILSAVLNE